MTEIPIKDAINLIRAAQKYGVTKLKIGTLEVEYRQDQEEIESRAPRPALKVSKKKIQEQTDKDQLQMDFDKAKDDISTLHVEDPTAFEQAIVENELEDDDTMGGESLEETHHIGAHHSI